MKEKRLTRSSEDKMVSGVAAGIANYLNIDPVIVRLAVALLILSNPPLGVIVYILLAILMPTDHAGEAIYNGFSDEEIVIKDS